MITVYRGINNSREVFETIKWLNKHHVEYNLINVDELNEKILKKILSLTKKGFEDVVIHRPRKASYYELIDYEDLSVNELVRYLIVFPEYIKEPIIFDDKNILIGYDKNMILKFL